VTAHHDPPDFPKTLGNQLAALERLAPEQFAAIENLVLFALRRAWDETPADVRTPYRPTRDDPAGTKPKGARDGGR
jgi:hypothetical protein